MKTLACLLLLASASRAALAQCPDFDGDFNYPGVDGRTLAALVADIGDGPKLYLGGVFGSAGEARARNVASFDGTHFQALGAGFSRPVEDLAVFDSGSGPALYAAGQFTTSGGSPTKRVARWNGTSWVPAGAFTGGNYSIVHQLEVFDVGNGPELFALGDFTNVDGSPAKGLARFDGSTWTAVPVSIQGFNGNEFFAAVRFDDGNTPRWIFKAKTAGGGIALYAWDGVNWTYLTQFSGANGWELVLHVFDDGHGPLLFVGGDFNSVAGSPPHSADGLAYWDGATWSELPGWNGAYVSALCTHDFGAGPALYMHDALRGFLRWDGTQLATLAPALNEGVLVAYDDGSNAKVWNFADIPQPSDSYALNVESFDGSSWSAPALAGDGCTSSYPSPLVQAFSEFADELYAGGTFATAGDTDADMLARFDGASWTAVPGADSITVVNALRAHDDGSGSKLFVGGKFATAGGVASAGIAAWDGAAWHALQSGLQNGTLTGVAHCFEVFDDGGGPALFVGGDFKKAGTTNASNIARWRGGAWSALGSGTNGRVRALQVFDDGNGPALYAAGEFWIVDGQGISDIARWDGASWTALDIGLDFHADALAVFDGGSGPELIVGGLFTHAGFSAAPYVAKWNGTSWSALPGGPTDVILALASYDDGNGPALIAGGVFSELADGSSARKLAKWNGSVWTSLGTGLDSARVPDGGRCTTLHVSDDGLGPNGSLYIGGIFNEAGARASTNIARWRDGCACSGTAYCTSGTTSSGCAPSISGVGHASASATSGFEIRVEQVEGARSGHLFYGLNGPNGAPWGQSSHFLCVKAPTQRTGTQSAGGNPGQCDGVLALDWNQYVATHPGALGTPFIAGVEVWAQGFFRDPAGVKTTALSNGLRFAVCP